MSAIPTSPTVVSLYDAKTHLSELGDRAAAGEEIVVTKHGKPKFRLVAVAPRKQRPLPGSIDFGLTDAERLSIRSHDWFAPDEEIERLFGTRE
jgi:prevent-host-death family protein